MLASDARPASVLAQEQSPVCRSGLLVGRESFAPLGADFVLRCVFGVQVRLLIVALDG